jgi:hypothetical protein
LQLAYALIPEKIFPLLSRFLLRHDLSFKIASLPAGEFSEKYLLALNGGQGSLAPIPGFILDYIGNLPFCHLFQGFANAKEDCLFLCEYGFQHPLTMVELVTETTATGLYLSFAGERSENSIIKPVPEFYSESSVLQYEVDFPVQQFDMVAELEPEKLALPLRFVDYKPGLSDLIPALFFEKREILWLQEMLYKLPGPLFAEIEWLGNRDCLFLFFNNSAGSSFFPFGQPFREIAPNIFIPADRDIVPHLEPEQLQELFQVESDDCVFITGDWRRDLPASNKAPLQQLLTVASDVKIEFQSDPDLNEFVWKESAVDTVKDILLQSANPHENESLSDMPAIPAAAQFASGVLGAEDENNSAVIEKSLNGYGNILRQQGDFLGAATCFSLAQNNLAAADCYVEAALALAKG